MGRRTGWVLGLLVALLALAPASASGRANTASTLTVQVIGAGRVSNSDGSVSCGFSRLTCHVSYTSTVILAAVNIAPGWTFSSWSGDCSGSSSCTLTADGLDHFVTATYTGPPTPEATLSVTYTNQTGSGGVVEGGTTSSNDQINCGTGAGPPPQDDCTWSGPTGSTLTVEETPDDGSVFSGWGGACIGTSHACSVYLTSDRFANAAWAKASSTKLLTVSVVGGGRVTGGGISCPGTCTANEPINSTVTLTATADEAAGYSFSSWTDGPCKDSPVTTCSVTMSDDATVSATFTKGKPELSVSVSGNGNVSGGTGAINCGNGGTICSASFTQDASITLTATPATGATFLGWTGACGGSTTTCTIAMSQSKSVTATFLGGTPNASFTLNVSVTGNGTVTGGGISCTSTGGTCSANQPPNGSVTLTAVAATGATFSGWGGACASSGTSTSCTVTMDAAKSVTATFSGGTPSGFQLTVTVAGNGTVTGSGISCGHGGTHCTVTATPNSTVTLTATPIPGATFKGWGGACTGTAKTCSITMNAAKFASASFSAPPPPATLTLTIAVTGAGTVSTSAGKCTSTAGKKKVCAQKLTKGAKATLTETPAKGAHLVAWGGACKVKTATCSLTMTSAKSVTATFATGTKPPQTKPSTLKSLHAPIVRKAKTGYTVTLQFQTAVGGIAHVRGLRAGRVLSTLSLKVAAGRATIGPFPVAKPGLYTFQVQLGKQSISWRACLGGCGKSAHAPAFALVREPPTATHTGDVWSVTLHVRANFESVARIRAYRLSKLLVDRHFLAHAGKIAVGPFLLAPGKYTLRLDATDPYGRTRTLTWIVALTT